MVGKKRSGMRFLLYNIRYGTGGRRRLPWSGYLSRSVENIREIAAFIKQLDPDVVGLIEVDAGSFRTRSTNQAELLASELGHYNLYRSKYHELSLAHLLPVVNKQGNALLTRDSFREVEAHYFDRGIKRLVIELELENVTIFLVHLALSFKARHHQLGELYEMVRNVSKPAVVAGDFNLSWGEKEIKLFLGATGLMAAGPENEPTYPSWNPVRRLDFFLHSSEIVVTRFDVPRVSYSDHLPLLCDFEIGKQVSEK